MPTHSPSSSGFLPVTLITGAAKRIGAAIAQNLAAQGYPVIVHCNRSANAAAELVDQIKRDGGKAALLMADLGDDAEIATMMQRAQAHFGPVRLLINNASLFEDDRLGTLAPHLWDEHFSVHLKAPVFLAQAMAQILDNYRQAAIKTSVYDDNTDSTLDVPDDYSGLIINMTDQRVWKLTPQFISYTLSKSALWTATQILAQALSPHIRVNAIAPGPTLPSARQNPVEFQKQVDAVLLKKAPQLDEFATTIDYLWKTKSVTGQMIALDGGQHLAWETPDITGISE